MRAGSKSRNGLLELLLVVLVVLVLLVVVLVVLLRVEAYASPRT